MHWEAIEYFLINGSMIAFVGFLLKHELNDIKARIVRLENIFLHSPDYKESSKNRWATLVVFILGSLITSSSFAATQVIGGAVGAFTGAEVLCQSPKFCPRVVAPDWSNPQRMYGTDPTCRLSNDGGANWVACTTQPSATSNNNNIAVARNGAVLWSGNDAGGTIYNIRRSTNGTTSWATVYTTATVDISGASGTSKIKCAQTTNTCLAYYISAGNVIQHLTSSDNGLTWSAGATIGTSAAGHSDFAMSLDGAHAIAPPSAADGVLFRAILYNSGTWSQSVFVWPTSAGGSCRTPFVVSVFNSAICLETAFGTFITTREENGLVQNLFNLSDRSPGGTAVLVAGTPSMSSTRVALIGTNAAGDTTIWTSFDSGNSWSAQGTLTEGVGNLHDSFSLHDCVYFSYFASGLNGRLTKICP